MGREVLTAYLFGSGQVVAAYRVAHTAVLSSLDLITADALSGAFLPIEARLVRENPGLARTLYRLLQFAFLGVALVALGAAHLLGWNWVSILAPGLGADTLTLAAAMVAAMSWGVAPYLYYNMLCYLDLAHGGYLLSGVRATGQSIGLIAGTLLAFFFESPALMAWGFTGAYYVMATLGFAHVKRRGYLRNATRVAPRSALPLLRVFAKRFSILTSLPAIALAVIATERVVSSGLGATAVAGADYARLVTDTGVLLLAAPLGLASLPTLALLSRAEAEARVRRALETMLTVALPLSVLVVTFAQPIVELLYGRGEFDEEAVRVTSSILTGLGVAMWAQMGVYFLAKTFNATERHWLSVTTIGIGAVITIITRPALVDLLGPLGLGMAASAGAVAALIFAAAVMGCGRQLTMPLIVAAPPTLACILLLRGVADASIIQTLTFFAAGCLIWTGWYALVPRTRRLVLSLAVAAYAAVRPRRGHTDE